MRTLRSLVATVLVVVMIACLSVSAFAAYEEITYDDVSEIYGTTLSGVNTTYIKFVDALHIVPALNDGSFNPNGVVTRIEALKMAYRMLHYGYDELANYESVSTDFDEINGGDINDVYTLTEYIAWAQDYQLINSEYVTDNKFEPNKPITGEEFIILMAKVLGIADGESTAEDYEFALDVVLMDSEVSAASETINREQAAVIVARAMMYDAEYGDVSEEMFSAFSDYNLNCLATNVYGCNNTQMVVRATKQRPMHYENVTGDVLLSNGAQVDIGADLSAFIGYQINLIYLDKDHSGTFTEDEEIITYEMVSPWVTTVSLKDMIFSSYTTLSGTNSQGGAASIRVGSFLYLNDNLWPEDKSYSLSDFIDFMVNNTAPANGVTLENSAIKNRPNLEFTFIQQSSADTAEIVLATEWVPGKIMTVTDNYMGIYSYYDGLTYVYDDNDIVMNSMVNPKSGDYVNFYIAGSKLYMKEGTTAVLTDYELATVDVETTASKAKTVEVLRSTAEDESTTDYMKHLFYDKSSVTLENLGGRPVLAILDTTRTTYIALEEPAQTEEVLIEIVSATVDSIDSEFADIDAVVVATGESIKLDDVRIGNITSNSGAVNAGDLYTYYVSEGNAVYMFGIDKVTTAVIEMDDYFITEGGVKYLKTEEYEAASDKTINGEAILTLDRYNGVRAAEKVA